MTELNNPAAVSVPAKQSNSRLKRCWVGLAGLLAIVMLTAGCGMGLFSLSDDEIKDEIVTMINEQDFFEEGERAVSVSELNLKEINDTKKSGTAAVNVEGRDGTVKNMQFLVTLTEKSDSYLLEVRLDPKEIMVEINDFMEDLEALSDAFDEE